MHSPRSMYASRLPNALVEKLDAVIETMRPKPSRTAVLIMLIEEFIAKSEQGMPKKGEARTNPTPRRAV